MKKFLLILVFALSLVIKAATVFAAGPNESGTENSKNVMPTKVQVSTSEVDSDGSSRDDEDKSASEMRIQNNITFGQVSSPVDHVQRVDSAKGPAEIQAKQTPAHYSGAEIKTGQSSPVGISLIPMVGGTVYQGAWNRHIRNNYTLGAALELSIIPLLSLEVEAAQGRYYISYSNYGHNFTQYTYGGSAKFYLTRGVVNTFLGGGILGVTYQNMTYGMNSFSTYDRTIGAGQILAGAEIALSQQVSLGVRGSYIVPLFNRLPVMSNGGYANPSFEEYSAMDTAMYRLMGAIKISL